MNTCRTTPGRRRHAIGGARQLIAAHSQARLVHRNPPSIPSSALRSCRRAALSPAASAPANSRPSGERRTPRRDAARLRVSARGAEMSPASPRAKRGAVFIPRTQRAGRLLRRADGGAEIHHRLGEIAGALRRGEFARKPAKFPALRAGSGVSTAKSRAITRSILPSTGLAGASKAIAAIGGGGVGTDARQRAQLRLRRRKLAAMTLDHGAGAGMQIAGAGVIAEPGPGFQHLLDRGRRQRAHVAPARQETARNTARRPAPSSAAA